MWSHGGKEVRPSEGKACGRLVVLKASSEYTEITEGMAHCECLSICEDVSSAPQLTIRIHRWRRVAGLYDVKGGSEVDKEQGANHFKLGPYSIVLRCRDPVLQGWRLSRGRGVLPGLPYSLFEDMWFRKLYESKKNAHGHNAPALFDIASNASGGNDAKSGGIPTRCSST